MQLKVTKLNKNAIIPTRGSDKASGLDLYSLEDVIVYPRRTILIKTGIAFGIPEGFEIQVRPRSGMSLKTGFRVANSPGTLDADYTGDCSIIAYNISDDDPVNIKRGDRIAQAVLCPVIIPELIEVENLDDTKRGDSGFGSSGK